MLQRPAGVALRKIRSGWRIFVKLILLEFSQTAPKQQAITEESFQGKDLDRIIVSEDILLNFWAVSFPEFPKKGNNFNACLVLFNRSHLTPPFSTNTRYFI